MPTIKGKTYRNNDEIADLGTLIEGSYSDAIDVRGCDIVAFQFSITNIGTDVTITLELSLDGTNYANYSYDGSNYTVTAAGNVILYFEACRAITYARASYVSQTGGTPTVAVKVKVV